MHCDIIMVSAGRVQKGFWQRYRATRCVLASIARVFPSMLSVVHLVVMIKLYHYQIDVLAFELL